MFNKFNVNWVESKYLFYFVLLCNILLLWFTKFYPSMDGPAHLYNSNILFHLLQGNKTLSEFYSVNSFPIPNWTSHIILLIFQSILPSWLAEKVLLVLYVSGMALSFRYLINELNPRNTSLSILIFPFIYSFLFHLGFYNYGLSFILFFFTLGYWLRNHAALNIYKYLFICSLLTVTYFTNLLIFGFLGLTLGVYSLYFLYKIYSNTKNLVETLQTGCKKLVFLFLISIPGIIFLVIFFINIKFYPSGEIYSVKELIKWINDARPFIVYDYAGEEIITEQFFHVLLLLLVISFIFKNIGKEIISNNHLEKINIIVIPLIVAAILYLITPNGSGAGMMSDRYCLILFILGLVWIVSRAISTRFNTIIIIGILVLHFGILFKHLNGAIRQLDADAQTINKAGYYIDENNIVLPVNLSDNWMEPHFSNYLGVDKPIIILENYEAGVGWFPIKWNLDRIPNIMLGDKTSISGIQWISNLKSRSKRQIDNVLLYGNTGKIDESEWQELKMVLNSEFELKYRSGNNYVMLFNRLQK